MPLFYLIAVGAGALTIGATAMDAKRWTAPDRKTAELTTFYQSSFDSRSDCLTAAATVGAPLQACGSEE